MVNQQGFSALALEYGTIFTPGKNNDSVSGAAAPSQALAGKRFLAEIPPTFVRGAAASAEQSVRPSAFSP